MKTKYINGIKSKTQVLYTLLAMQAISLVGTRMTTIALGIWLYQRTGKTMDLLLIPLFNELPSLLFGHVIGTFVDRYDRKMVMMVSDLGQALGTLLLFMSIGSGHFQTVHLYIVVFLQGVFSTAQEPAADATVSLLTGSHNRSRVNAVKGLAFPAAGILAPVLAGIAYVAFGIAGVILIDLVTFLLATAIMVLLKIPKPAETEVGDGYGGSFFKSLRGGFGFIFKSRGLLFLILFMSIVNFILNGPLELVIPYILEVTQSELILSSMLSLMSVSTALTSVILSVVSTPKRKLNLAFAGVLVSSIGLILFGMARNVALLSISLFMVMMPLPALNVVFKTILQEKTPEDLQGRVFSSAYQLAYGIAPLSFLVVGGLVDKHVEPYVQSGQNEWLSGLFGMTPGAGMGLVLSLAGLLLGIVLILFWTVKSFRNMEENLKTYN